MPIQNNIRDLYKNGQSKSQIAKALSIDRKTVRKYLAEDDFSPDLPLASVCQSVVDPYKEIIDEWLEADRSVFYKQRHTAVRITERLVEERGYTGGYGPVQRYVKQKREQMTSFRPVVEPLDLVWEPGSMQVDFGQADAEICGKRSRKHYLTNSYPYSNAGFTQIFGGETAECFCTGLKDTFEYVGSVPHTVVLDNATGVGKRIKKVVLETELFARFRAHYGFDVRFCNVNSGHEKGSVERKVSFHRKRLFVPVPVIEDIKGYNKELFDQCLVLSA